MSYALPPKSQHMAMTSASDRQTHTITSAEFDAGVWDGKGTYRAVCGRVVLAAPLVAGPGRQCPDCPPLPEEDDSARVGWLRAVLATLPGFAGLLRPGTAPRTATGSAA